MSIRRIMMASVKDKLNEESRKKLDEVKEELNNGRKKELYGLTKAELKPIATELGLGSISKLKKADQVAEIIQAEAEIMKEKAAAKDGEVEKAKKPRVRRKVATTTKAGAEKTTRRRRVVATAKPKEKEKVLSSTENISQVKREINTALKKIRLCEGRWVPALRTLDDDHKIYRTYCIGNNDKAHYRTIANRKIYFRGGAGKVYVPYLCSKHEAPVLKLLDVYFNLLHPEYRHTKCKVCGKLVFKDFEEYNDYLSYTIDRLVTDLPLNECHARLRHPKCGKEVGKEIKEKWNQILSKGIAECANMTPKDKRAHFIAKKRELLDWAESKGARRKLV